MAETITETTHNSFGKSLLGSLSGLIIGPLLFLAAFVVLYWNEGRVDLSLIAKDATIVTAPSDVQTNGELISVSDKITSTTGLSDAPYLKSGTYVALNRIVEMYQWVEDSSSSTTSNTGGSSDTITTYTYRKDWSPNLIDSSTFHDQAGHTNPNTMAIESSSQIAPDATMGQFKVSPNSLTLPTLKVLTLDSSNTQLVAGQSIQQGSFIYQPVSDSTGGYQVPSIGDIRISYGALMSGTSVTLFGTANGAQLESYTSKDGVRLYRLFESTHDEAITQLRSEYTATTWILRFVGFFMMWIGMMMFFNPIITLLNVLPIMGRLSGAVLGLSTGVISFALSVVTIIVSMFLHSFWALIVAVVVAAVVLWRYFVRLKNKEQAGKMPPATPTTPPAVV